MSATIDWLTTIGTAIIGAIVGAAAALFVREWSERRTDEKVRQQIRYLLRSLAIQMGMARDYPVNTLTRGFDLVFGRLVERVLSADGARALTKEQSSALFDAINETEQSIEFLNSVRDHFLAKQDDREYIVAAAQRSFRKLLIARDAIGDKSALLRPSDPRGLHNWHPGSVIERDS